jgi:hypothetical protein
VVPPGDQENNQERREDGRRREEDGHFVSRARPRAYFATAHVPMAANSATKTPIGMVEPLPSLLWKTALGPQTEATATAIHIAKIASDAQTSLLRSSETGPTPGRLWWAGPKWSTSDTSSLARTFARTQP